MAERVSATFRPESRSIPKIFLEWDRLSIFHTILQKVALLPRIGGLLRGHGEVALRVALLTILWDMQVLSTTGDKNMIDDTDCNHSADTL